MTFSLLGVWAFGEAEFWLALTKVLAIAAFFICSILISTGVIGHRKIGFKYYHDPGPFNNNGAKGIFQIFVFVLWNCLFRSCGADLRFRRLHRFIIGVEGMTALGTRRRAFVQIIKLCLAVRANLFCTKFWIGHVLLILQGSK